jgi:integrase
MKATQLPSGNWRAQYSTGEKNQRGKYIYGSVTKNTEKEAIFAALELELKHKDVARNPTSITLYEAMEKYIESKSNVLSPSTICGYSAIYNNNLKMLMQVKLKNLNNNIIQSAINDEAKTHSPKTVRNIHGLLSAVLNLFHPDLKVRVTLPPKQRKEMNILTVEQSKILFKAIENTDIEIPVLLAACFGLRQSEITGLKWDCIDSDNNVITIKNALVRGQSEYVLKSTKTYASTRKIIVPEFIMEKIKNLTKSGEFVINIKNHTIYKRFKKVLVENNLPPEIRFHDLRHFNASVMLQLNIPDKYAMERGGWNTNNTMKNIYQHTFSEERKSVDAIVNNYFESLIKT